MPKSRRDGSKRPAAPRQPAAPVDREPAGAHLPPRPLGAGDVVKFLLVSGVSIAVLTWGWAWVGPAYSGGFRTVFDGLLDSLGVRIVNAEAEGPRDPHDDLRLLIPRTETRFGYALPLSPRSLGYLPSVMVVALGLATPLPWKRRFRAMLGAVAWTQAYVVLRVLLSWAFACCVRDAYQEGAVTPWWLYALGFLHDSVFRRTGATYLLPVLIWLGACVRMNDVRAWLGEGRAAGEARGA